MANYQKGQKIGGPGPGDKSGQTFFYGASEAPRVHGLTGARYDSVPRFKNNYFVAFKYSNLAIPVGIEPKDTLGITHRVKSIDAPRFEIETETLNQYNKPRILPTKINYSPVTITFHDDRSNEVTNFWRQVYEFYFYNGRRTNENQYSVRDRNEVTDIALGNRASTPGYANYGYYIGNKVENMNLFTYMSLYLVANKSCHRMDLLNPYIQSMNHDQFSQEMSGELAQNTVTWGYENVVYYGRTIIEEEPALMGVIGGMESSIFHWDATSIDYRGATNVNFGALYANAATGESTTPVGKNPAVAGAPFYQTSAGPGTSMPGFSQRKDKQNVSSATKAPTGNDIDFYETYGPGLGGYKPVSGITASAGALFTHLGLPASYKAMAVPERSTHPGLIVDVEEFLSMPDRDAQLAKEKAIANAVDDFSDFPVDPKEQSGLDKIKTECDGSAPAAGTNNRPTTAKPWINPNTGKPVTAANVGLAPSVAYMSQQLGLPQTTNPAPYPPDDPPNGR